MKKKNVLSQNIQQLIKTFNSLKVCKQQIIKVPNLTMEEFKLFWSDI